MPDIRMPDGIVVRFPDDMPSDQIKGLIASKFPELAQDGGAAAPQEAVQVDPGIATGLTALLEQGASLGLSDEVAGAGRAAGRFIRNAFTGEGLTEGVGDAYARGRDQSRAAVEYAREQAPVAGTVAEIGGALATGPGKTVMKAGQSVLERILAAVKEGAVFGGAYGTATAEGDAVDRVEGGVEGAIAGGVTAGLLPPTLKVGEIVTRPVRTAAKMLRPTANAESRVVEALSRDNTTPEKVASSLRRAQNAGVPQTIADVAGYNVQRTMRQARTVPGAGSEKINRFLAERQMEQPDRVLANVQRALGGDDVYKVADDVAATRSRLADKMYSEAFEQAQPVQTAHVLAKIDNEAEIAAGKIKSSLEKVKKQIGAKTDLEALHNVKMELDDAIGAAKRAGKNNQARVLMGVKDQLVKAMDRSAPKGTGGYKEARNTFSSLSDLTDALGEGQKFLNRDSRLTAKQLAGMTEGEREMFRLGASEALAQKINAAPDGAGIARRIFGNRETRAKLRAVFPDKQSFRKFEAMMLREAKTTATNQIVRGNSQTADKLAEVVDATASDVMRDLTRGDVPGAVARSAGAALNVAQGVTPKTAEKIADILTSTDPAVIDQIMQALARRSRSGAAVGRGVNVGLEAGARGTAIGISGN